MTAVVPRDAAPQPGTPPGPTAEATPEPAPAARRLPRAARAGQDQSWVWPLAAVVLGAVGALWPLAAVALLAAGVVVVLALAAPRTTAGLAAMAVLFVRPLEHLVPVTGVGYL